MRENVKTIIKKYDDYTYYFGVVKADSYGHLSTRVVKSIIDGGCNYLAVSSLEAAIQIRKEYQEIPILCFGVILKEYLPLCRKYKVTISIPSLTYFESITSENLQGISMHLKLDTGMHRLGVTTKEEVTKIYQMIKERGWHLEGIYTHIYQASDRSYTKDQIDRFYEMTCEIDLKQIPIVHIAQSDTLLQYPHIKGTNGCRLGIIMYGLAEHGYHPLKSTFSLHSRVVALKTIEKGDVVGYEGVYQANSKERIAVVETGYADGIVRANTGREVYINGTAYPIVGNICMDMRMVHVDRKVIYMILSM